MDSVVELKTSPWELYSNRVESASPLFSVENIIGMSWNKYPSLIVARKNLFERIILTIATPWRGKAMYECEMVMASA